MHVRVSHFCELTDTSDDLHWRWRPSWRTICQSMHLGVAGDPQRRTHTILLDPGDPYSLYPQLDLSPQQPYRP